MLFCRRDIFREDFGGERVDSHVIGSPGISRQTGLSTGVGKKLLSPPAIFDRHLRQKKSPRMTGIYHESMYSDFNGLWLGSLLKRRKNRYLDFHISKLIVRERQKSRVLECGLLSNILNRPDQRRAGLNITDAPAELAMEVQRYERTAFFLESGADAITSLEAATLERACDRSPRSPQEFFFVDSIKLHNIHPALCTEGNDADQNIQATETPIEERRHFLLLQLSFLTFALSIGVESAMSLMVSISGIRGIVGSSLTPETVVKYAAAFADYCKGGPIVLGRDGRISGKSIAHIVSSTLSQMGCDVIAIGICPTPTVALGVMMHKAAGGIAITASHNPMQWNGMKFLASTSLFLDADENRDFWAIAGTSPRVYPPWDQHGNHIADPGMIDKHIANVLSIPYIDVEQVRRRKFRVVLDCVNAAGGVIIPNLLREFGCDVVEMNCDISGIFSHTPEPVPENLTDLSARVKQERADIGIAVDPDVDRLVLIDEKGEPFGEEYTIASVVQFVLGKEAASQSTGDNQQSTISAKGGFASGGDNRKSKSPCVVVNLSTTRAIDDICARFGAVLIRTPVGEINVAKKMKEVGAIVGGEGSGGVILPASHIGRDAPVGIGLTLQHLAEFGGQVSELKQSLPQYSITKGKVDLGTLNPDDILKKLQDKYSSKGKVTTSDGVKLDFPDNWVHLRKSNTEPIIRIIAEAADKRKADELVSSFISEIKSL